MKRIALILSTILSVTGISAQAPSLNHDYTFDVPEGNYKVTLVVGSKERPAVTTLKAESLRLVCNDVATRKGQFKTLTFTVNKRDTLIYQDGNVVDCIIPNFRDRKVPDWDSKLTFDVFGEESAVKSLEIEPVEDVITVYLCGDSTVCDQFNPPYYSWGQNLPLFFDERVSVANYAFSGASTSSFISTKKFAKIVGNLKPGDYVFIEFGHNDENYKGPGAGPRYNFAYNLRSMVDQVKAKGAVPVILTPTQRRNFDAEGRVGDTHKGYVEAAKEVADREDVICIDLAALTAGMIEAAGEEGSWQYFVKGDSTHNNEYGAFEICKIVVKSLIDGNIPLAKYLRNYPGEAKL